MKGRKSAPIRPAKTRDPFRYVTADAAKLGNKAKGVFSTHRAHVDIYVHELERTMSEDQKGAISAIYDQHQDQDYSYRFLSDSEQANARSLLMELGLDSATLASVNSKFSIRWSKVVGKGDLKEKRELYSWSVQNKSLISLTLTYHSSDCGYNHLMAGSKKRHNQWEFTGCLAHIEVTHHVLSGKILRIRGHFEHNDGCKVAVCSNRPNIPLHPSVFNECLEMLNSGHTLASVISRNEHMYDAYAYPTMPKTEADILQSRYRWLLDAKDHRTLYRMLDRRRGVNVKQDAHINIDEWLNQDSPLFDKTLASSVFHYKPRTNKEDRFELCISTKEMREASWAYAHKKQIILDGTFGISVSKVLLFIVMAVDEFGKGVPLALLLFSAPSDNRHTAAGYDSSILEKLLKAWRDSLGLSDDGHPFVSAVAITDTDLKERRALDLTYPSILLLICRFHIRQSWQNHRNKCLRGNSAAHSTMRSRLRRLEDTLLATTIFDAALNIIKAEKEDLDRMSLTEDEVVAKGALEHVHYLGKGYWMTSEALWSSWSDKGRHDASAILQCPVEAVVGTTNHLESFNGLLKNQKLQRFKRNNRRLRLDLLVRVLIDETLPEIFKRKQLRQREKDLINKRIMSLPGGEKLVRMFSHIAVASSPIAYLKPDDARDKAAQDLLSNRQISIPEFSQDGFTFTCYSSLTLAMDAAPVTYNIVLRLDGQADCSCPDFQRRGGACKHMRAALLRLDQLRKDSPQIPLPQIILPTSEHDARQQVNPHAQHTSLVSDEDLVKQTDIAFKSLLLDEEDDIFEQGSSDVEPQDSGSSSLIDNPPEAMSSDNLNTNELDRSQDEYDIPVLHSAAKIGVDDQSVIRVLRDLEHVAPKLSQLAEYLRGVHLRTELIPQVLACRISLQPIIEALDRALEKASEDDISGNKQQTRTTIIARGSPSLIDQSTIHSTQPHSESKFGSVSSNKRRLDILPPSPEKGSTKRHHSYSVN